MTRGASEPPRPGVDSCGGPQVAEFRAVCERLAGRSLTDAQSLHDFSVEQSPLFWRALLEWSELPWSGVPDPVLVGEDVETARFFPALRLNYAEALLRPLPGVDDGTPAVVARHADRPAERVSRRELRESVAVAAAALAALGLRSGDRVVAIAPNGLPVTVAVLAAAALGVTVSTCTPDVGVPALLARFQQVEPALLLLDRRGLQGDAGEATARLLAELPTLRHLVTLDDLPPPPSQAVPVSRFSELVADARDAPRPTWPALPFDHPLFVMHSSGTTGPPKAIVHGAGGTLLEHVKEHRLHGDLRSDDTLYFHTTTAWMMWNWQLSALAVGACVVLYDGPLLGPETLWELVASEGVTVFGTSPAYLQLCEDEGYRPAVDLHRLRSVLSTGSVLHEWQYRWLAAAVGPQPLQSISGGTDILGCFVLGHPELPVRPGRCSSRSLGLDVAAVDDEGREVVGRIGELVCRRPFPSRPLCFIGDPDGKRFHESYFAANPGMWTHGDLIEFGADGTARLHGRSDGVLNIDGVRIGPSEIYTVLQALPEIADALAVEQRAPGGRGESRMVLLVVLRPGARFDGDLERMIRRRLRREASRSHVPALIVAVPDLPFTHNGKRSERAARDAVNGDEVGNADSLRNPGSLAAIRAAVQAVEPEAPGPAEGRPASPVPDDVRVDEHLLREIKQLWSQTLGVEGAVPIDDFFDMGGTSRSAVILLRRLRLECGVDVPIREFLREPTVAALTRAAATGDRATWVGAPLLRSGVGRPVFVPCDAWGQLNSFHGLVRSLDTDRPVVGLQPSLVDALGRRRSIVELARETTEQALEVQPDGPVSLLGYSFGGLVAYEMACQLAVAGHEVAFVGLIDVFFPTAALEPAQARARRRSRRLQVLRSPAAVSRQIRSRLGSRVTVGPQEAALDESWRIYHAHQPAPYPGTVTFYRAAVGEPVMGDLAAGWQRAVRHLMVTDIPGNHDDLLSERYVGELAARVSATLA